jgi:hypothetical protein
VNDNKRRVFADIQGMMEYAKHKGDSKYEKMKTLRDQ